MILIAEALSRGNSKTNGFRSRLVPVPGTVVRKLFLGKSAKNISEQQIDDIDRIAKVLKVGLAIISAGGKKDEATNNFQLKKQDDAVAESAQINFQRKVDGIFFSALWKQLEVSDRAQQEKAEARYDFINQLVKAAKYEFYVAMPGISCSSIHRPRAEARARRYFTGRLHSMTQKVGAKYDVSS